MKNTKNTFHLKYFLTPFLLTFFFLPTAAYSISLEIRRVSDDTLVTTGVNFQTVPNAPGISQAEHYAIIRYDSSDTDTDSLHIFSNNTPAPTPRDGLRHLPSLVSKAPVYYKVFDSRQTGLTMTPATRATWNLLYDVNDPGFPHQRVPAFGSGTSYIYFAADVNSSNLVGNYAVLIKIKNYPFQITTQPNTQIIFQGNPVSFGVAADGVPPLTYQWKRNNTNIPGATNSVYTFGPVSLADNLAVFKCEVRDGLGRLLTSADAALIVVAAPIIVTQPQPQTVLEGQPATFSIAAVGFPDPVYQWFRNSAAIPGANQPTYTIPSTLLSDNGALISCGVLNDLGYAVSQQVTLTVQSVGSPPVITSHPQSQSIPEGQPVTFQVAAVGQNLSYQWFRNGASINNATAASYAINAVQPSDNGAQFYCRVSNTNGNVNSNTATLTVLPPNTPPVIQTHPVSQYINQGQAATFSVLAVSALPMAYQWQKNNVNIAGATSANYTTPPTTLSDNGARYRCIVSNTAGSITSNEAVLTVIPQSVYYTLTVQNGSGGGSYVPGFVVPISANPPAPGMVFESWSGATVADPTSPNTTIAMPAAHTTVTANYRALGGSDPIDLTEGFGDFEKIIKPGQGSTLNVRFRMSKNSSVSLSIYDRRGRHIKELVDGDFGPGEHEARWDGKLEGETVASSGAYILVLKISGSIYRAKIVLIR